MKKLTLVLLWIGLAGCLTGTGTSPAGITAPQDSPFAGTHSSGNSSPTASVMGPLSDDAESESGRCANLKQVKKEYEGTTLRIPDCFAAHVGWQAPDSQTPLSAPDPVPLWTDNRWDYSLTLMIYALYKKSAPSEYKDYEHADLKHGPIVRLVFSDAPPADAPAPNWDPTTSFCDIPIEYATSGEFGLVSNLTIHQTINKDTEVSAYLYYHPDAGASSAVDFDPVQIPGSPFLPAPNPCDLMVRFNSEDEFNQFATDIHTYGLGRYLMNIDETVQSSPPSDSGIQKQMSPPEPETKPSPFRRGLPHRVL